MATLWTDEELREAVRNSLSVTDVVRKLYKNTGCNNYATVKKYILKLGIDTSHFVRVNGRKNFTFEKRIKINSGKLRQHLLKVKEYVCAICENPGEHLGKPLTLQIDHIDGDNSNNVIENLRWLCPNCHTQTDTYGKPKTIRTRIPASPFVDVKCASCGKSHKKTLRVFRENTKKMFYCCVKCTPSSSNLTDDEILEAFNSHGSFLGASKALGISDVSVKKRIMRIEDRKS